jgi:hypothetical protein
LFSESKKCLKEYKKLDKKVVEKEQNKFIENIKEKTGFNFLEV